MAELWIIYGLIGVIWSGLLTFEMSDHHWRWGRGYDWFSLVACFIGCALFWPISLWLVWRGN